MRERSVKCGKFLGLVLVLSAALFGACSTVEFGDLTVGACVEANEGQMAFGTYAAIECADFDRSNLEHWRVLAVGTQAEVQARCPTLLHGVIFVDGERAVCFGKSE